MNEHINKPAMRQEFGPNAAAERAHRDAVIPLVNDAYAAGLHGEGGYPLDMGEEIRQLADHLGKPVERVRENKLLPPLIEWVTRPRGGRMRQRRWRYETRSAIH